MKKAAGLPATPAARSAAASSRSTRRPVSVVWKTYTIPDQPQLLRVYADGTELRGPSGGAIWSAPTIDAKRGALYVGVGNTYSGAAQPTTDAILAFDLKSGAMRWTQQMPPATPDVFGCTPGDVNCGERPGPDFDFGASPVLATLATGRQLIVAGQKSGIVYALDPDRQGGGCGATAPAEAAVSAASSGASPRTRIARTCPSPRSTTPEPGGLHALDLATGKRAWYAPPDTPVCGTPSRACSGAQFSAVSAIPGIVFSPSNDGAVRAYSAKDGAVVWRFDTQSRLQDAERRARQRRIDERPRADVAGGRVYIGSGYGAFGLRPGNVLLAFGVE